MLLAHKPTVASCSTTFMSKKAKGKGGKNERFKLSKSAKRRNKKPVNKRAVPELADLLNPHLKDVGTYGHRMADEVRYTNQHREDTLRHALRNLPVEFVKASKGLGATFKESIDKLSEDLDTGLDISSVNLDEMLGESSAEEVEILDVIEESALVGVDEDIEIEAETETREAPLDVECSEVVVVANTPDSNGGLAGSTDSADRDIVVVDLDSSFLYDDDAVIIDTDGDPTILSRYKVAQRLTMEVVHNVEPVEAFLEESDLVIGSVKIGKTIDLDELDSDDDFSDEYDSEQSFQDHLDELMNLGDGLDDLLEFAALRPKQNGDFETRLLRTKGKGSAQILDLDSDMDADLMESLQEQFLAQKRARREKKLKRKEAKYEEAVASHNLHEKYSHSMKSTDFEHEFDALLMSFERDAVTFPPLDKHGNDMIRKLADCYNMKAVKVRVGGLGCVRVVKTRKTANYIPRHDQVRFFVKQRPFFRRIDAPSETKAKSEKSKKSEAYFKEGDVVGEKAPEIAPDNFGRQLLVKMGWVNGEGLGVQGKKGITAPLTATVKISKMGLR